MNTPAVDFTPHTDSATSSQAMDKLRAIDQQRNAVEQRLAERLPRQLSQLAARVCATKWRLAVLRRLRKHAYTQELVDAVTKQLRMEVGAFEYAAKEQSELLTRALFQLDDILSHGDDAVKTARKALVLSTQQLLERADAMKAKAASLKQFTDRMLEALPTVPEDAGDEDMDGTTTEAEADATPVSQEHATNDHDDGQWEHVSSDDVRPLFASDDEEEEASQMEQESAQQPVSMEDAVMVDAEEATSQNDDDVDADVNANGDDEDDEDDEDNEDNEEEEEEEKDAEEDVTEDGNAVPASEEVEQQRDSEPALPVWRPYYQIQKRADGVYLVANLRGVDPRCVQVHAMPQRGVLRISGVKYPTQKDLLLSRLSGAPTFGRFEIVERFPTHTLNLENASQQLSEDGTLEVRLPFYLVQHPRILRRVSPFQPHRLVVW